MSCVEICSRTSFKIISGSSQGFASFDQKPAQPPFGGQPTPFAGGQPTPFAGGQPTAFGRDSTAFADFSQSSPFGGQPLSSQSDPFTSVSSAPSSSVSFDAFAQSPAKQSYPASNGSNDFNAFPTQPQQLGKQIFYNLLSLPIINTCQPKLFHFYVLPLHCRCLFYC